jgi:hypothetical protein
MRHREATVKARGDLPVTVGFVRLVNDLPPRIPENGAGKHRPECTDATIIFYLTWDDVSPVTNSRRVLPRNPNRRAGERPPKPRKRWAKGLALAGR